MEAVLAVRTLSQSSRNVGHGKVLVVNLTPSDVDKLLLSVAAR